MNSAQPLEPAEPAEPAESAWFTSSYSGNEGGECVEVAATPGTGAGIVHVRDSKDRTVPALAFGADAWDAFVALVSLR
ncbi:DUF397 domain-containing protein [Streptomyces sp. NBC_01537]|uniref:DUF397 domain-containing protein n=1 Tax=Streptomyces sp. NBC_01537 TaxID=2903896 RepID=UPI00386C2BB6